MLADCHMRKGGFPQVSCNLEAGPDFILEAQSASETHLTHKRPPLGSVLLNIAIFLECGVTIWTGQKGGQPGRLGNTIGRCS